MSELVKGLRVRKLADKSSGERVKRYDPVTGESYLADPATWNFDDRDTWTSNPWPLVGVVIEGETPKKTALNTGFVNKAVDEGWAELENKKVVHRPGGPKDNLWQVTHTFVQADAILFHFMDGDLKYKVVQNPDKYPAEKNDDDEGYGGEVKWYYEVELEEDNG